VKTRKPIANTAPRHAESGQSGVILIDSPSVSGVVRGTMRARLRITEY
jgi:hypothetical protein